MRSMAAALLGLVFWGFAVSASAQNGLQRFESEIKPQFEVKKFTYGNASALGSAGFVLNDVVVVIPGNPATGDKESTIKIDKVTVDELDFDRLKKGTSDDELPRFAKLKIEGMTGDDTLSTVLAPYGVPKVPVDVTLDYRLDTASKVLTLSKLEVNLRGESRVALALVLDGISDKSSQMQGSKDDGRLRTASLDIDDTGLIAKVLPALAKAQGSTPEAMVAMATVPLAGFTAGQGPATLKALDSIVSFIGDWKQPKGPIKIAIKPAKTASIADLDKVMEPNALTDIFGLTVDYAGTRAGAASGCQCRRPHVSTGGGDTPAGGRRWQDPDGRRSVAVDRRQHAHRQDRRRCLLRVLPQGRHAHPDGGQRPYQGQVDHRGRESLLQISRRGQGLLHREPERRDGHARRRQGQRPSPDPAARQSQGSLSQRCRTIRTPHDLMLMSGHHIVASSLRGPL
jgi:hypothetical protein